MYNNSKLSYILGAAKMKYYPTPIDTSKIELSSEIQELTEVLAENTHDLWAQQRIKEGWRYGTNRDDIQKTHPGLRPYNQLTETEKEYDRITAMNTLKAMMALGYKIEKKEN